VGQRGGRRIGAGRKPKNRTANVLQHPSSVAPPSTNEPSPVEEFDAPNDLTAEERAIWLKQAPHAFANRTLTRASAMAFERYCKVVVLERNEAKSSGVGGANHRGLLKQINTYELQFLLMPMGKAMPVPVTASVADPDEAFFG
jgi:hypothetical protein